MNHPLTPLVSAALVAMLFAHPHTIAAEPTTYPDALVARSDLSPTIETQGIDGFATALAPDGSVYVAGSFNSIEGVAISQVARFTAAGAFDPTFVPPLIENGDVRVLAVQADGKLLIGGSCTRFNGVNRNRLARLNPDGSLDESFSIGSGFASAPAVIAVQPDGKILVGGSIASFNLVATRNLVRLDATGALDTAFTAAVDFNGSIAALALQPDGKIIAAGTFTAFGATTRLRVARVNADGTLDPTFGSAVGLDGAVTALARATDGKVVVGGSFTGFNGTASARVARLDTAGALDPTFSIGTTLASVSLSSGQIVVQSDGSVLVPLSATVSGSPVRLIRIVTSGGVDGSYLGTANTDEAIQGITAQSDGRLLVCGLFRRIGSSARLGLARLTSAGTLDAGFTFAARRTGEINTMVEAPTGGWIIGGDFSWVNGVSRNCIAKISDAGVLDAAFAPGAGFSFSVAPFISTLNGLAVDASNRVLAGGNFSEFNGTAVQYLARLTAGAAIDTVLAPSGTVHAIAVQTDGKLIVVGAFSSFSGTSSPRIVRLLATGAVDSSFTVGTGFDASAFAVTIQTDGRILVGGSFTTFNGTARTRLARLNSDGTLDTSFDPGSGANGNVRAIAVLPDERILVGGFFTTFAGVTRNYLARLSATGALDTTFVPTSTQAAPIWAMRLQTDGRVITGREMTVSGASTVGALQRLNTDGTRDVNFTITGLRGPLFSSGQVRAVGYTSEGRLVIGGRRLILSDGRQAAFVRLDSPIVPVIGTQPLPQGVQAGGAVTLGVSATVAAGGPLTYQWQRNGFNVIGATGATLTLPSAQTFHAGSYTVVVSGSFGSVTSTAATITVNAAPASGARLLNLSTRALALTGNDVLIPGFVVSGSADKRLLMRVVGPTLGQFGVAGTLPNPRMTLKRFVSGSYQDFAANDDWSTNTNAADIVSTSANLFAFALATGSADAALLLDLPPGQYTIVGDDVGGATGVAIVELYDADASAGGSRLTNISNRGFVGTGGNVMIPGFVVSNEGSKTFLIRVVGPALAQFGVTGVLADPKLSIFSGNTAILTNDEWWADSDPALTTQVAAQVFAFPLPSGSLDAALVVTLAPGAYTVQASGFGSSTGVALVEIYEVP